MMTASNKDQPFGVKTTLVNYWNASERSEPVEEGSTRRSRTFTLSAALTMTLKQTLPKLFTRPSKTNSIGPLTGHTAAEIIKERANANTPHMGLTTWKNAPRGKALNRIVTMYLDFAELQAERQNAMKMNDWVNKLDGFLQLNDYKVLKDAGKISATIARQLAEQEYQKFRIEQDKAFESDFDKEVKKITQKGKDKR